MTLGRPHPTVAVRSAGLFLAAVLGISGLSACSSSTKSSDTSSSSAASSSAAAPVTGATAGSAGGSSGSSADAGSPADVAAITHAYETFFDAKTDLKTSESLLQDGPAFADVLTAQGKSQYASQASAKVNKVVVNSPTKATVTFSILLNGSPILPNQTGYAVKSNGTWQLAGSTFCALLTAEGQSPAVCKQAAATAMPGS